MNASRRFVASTLMAPLGVSLLLCCPTGALALSPISGLVSHWPAEGTPEDIVGANEGQLRNGASFAPGLSGLAFSLDGLDDYILVPNSSSLNFGLQDFSISLWEKTNFYGSGVGTDFLLSKVETGTVGEYSLQYNSNIDGRSLFSVIQQGSWHFVSAGPNLAARGESGFGQNRSLNPKELRARKRPPNYFCHGLLGDNAWHHVVGVRKGTEIQLYVDCQLVARGGCFGCGTLNTTGSRNVVIGGRENPGSDPYFKGLIDEVAIYGKALSQAEVRELYSSSSGKECP